MDEKEGLQKNTPTQPPFSSLAKVIFIVIAATLASCTSQPQSTRQAPPRMVGADRDEHGCIGSAGYSWCAREGACARPWELAREKGFEPNAAAFKRYCSEDSQ